LKFVAELAAVQRVLSYGITRGLHIKWMSKPIYGTTKKGQLVKMYGEAYNPHLDLTIKLGSLVKLAGDSVAEVVFLFEKEEEKFGEFRTVVITDQQARCTEGFLDNYLANVVEVLDFTSFYFVGPDKGKSEDSRLLSNRDRSRFYKTICDISQKASLLQAAASLLTLNSVPSCLVGREDEADRLLMFLRNGLRNEGSQSSLCNSYTDMFGMPGTGKTATFLYAMHSLKQELRVQASQPYKFIQINCMKIAKPQDLYVALAAQLLKATLSPVRACRQLNNFFQNPEPHRPVLVLLVDELDAIVNRRQDVLYNIFNWTSFPSARLLVVGIANTMDLTERFMHKISSRVGEERIVFKPYSRDCLQLMIRKRLEHTRVFTEDSINFACAKVASYSGDARRAFHVCRRAIYLSQDEGQESVCFKHVQQAFEQLYSPVSSRAVAGLPKYMKLFLVTCCLESKLANKESFTLESLTSRCNTALVNKLQEAPLKPGAIKELTDGLLLLNLLCWEKQKLRLRVEVDEVCEALEGDELFRMFADNF
jgi:origin recognition complex subunit 1